MKVKVRFSVATTYVGSKYEEDLELEVDDNLSIDELEAEIDEYYNTWVWEHINGGFEIIEEN